MERWLRGEENWLFFSEVLSSIPSTSMVAHNHLLSQPSDALFWRTGTHADRASIHKINLKEFNRNHFKKKKKIVFLICIIAH